MHKSLTLFCALLSGPLAAAEINIEVQIPRLVVAEYHRPYVALWLEHNNRHAADIAVWYDLKLADREGEKWLKDLRQWWRRSGRSLELPIDGLSAATRPPGTHRVTLANSDAPLKALAPGEYELVVEAAREVGGREMLRMPFHWPPSEPTSTSTEGNNELGRVTLTLAP